MLKRIIVDILAIAIAIAFSFCISYLLSVLDMGIPTGPFLVLILISICIAVFLVERAKEFPYFRFTLYGITSAAACYLLLWLLHADFGNEYIPSDIEGENDNYEVIANPKIQWVREDYSAIDVAMEVDSIQTAEGLKCVTTGRVVVTPIYASVTCTTVKDDVVLVDALRRDGDVERWHDGYLLVGDGNVLRKWEKVENLHVQNSDYLLVDGAYWHVDGTQANKYQTFYLEHPYYFSLVSLSVGLLVFAISAYVHREK